MEETVTVGGTLLRLIDTAGLRDTPDRVEQMGVERSRAAMESAELILVLWDSSSPVTQEDGELLSQAMSLAPTVLVRSKSDLLSAPLPLLSLAPMPPVVELSARTGQGLEELEQAIRSALPRQTGEEAYGELLTNARQEEAASRALSGWRAPRLDCPPASPRTPCLPTWRRPSPPWGSSPAPPCGRTSPTGSSSVSALENKRSARTFRSAR